MVDSARQLLDELMGRNRNLDPSVKCKQLNWEDPEFCQYYLVKFCPHDLFVNTKADLGQCPKLHDDEAKRLFDETRSNIRKRQHEDEFLRFCNNMINEVDRKIQKGKQRLLLMNKGEQGTHTFVSKQQEQLNVLNDRIKKLVGEAEEAGHRGDVDQAQGLMKLCDKLKEEKETLLKGNENSHWSVELAQAQEKQMEVCEVCGAFLIVGDAQQRIEDHLTGKQHLGYSRLRKAVEDMYEMRRKERDDDDKKRSGDDERKVRSENGSSSSERSSRRDDRHRRPNSKDEFDDRRRKDDRDRERGRRDRDKYRSDRDHRTADRDRRERDRERDRHRHRSDRDRDNRRRSRSRSEH